MKKFISCLLAFAFCLSLFGCSDNSAKLPKPNISGDNTVLGSDFQKNMNQSKAPHLDRICENEDGYFFCYAGMNVYYLDKASGESTILCAKPECSHTDETCNAYTNGNFLTYYDGKLYWSHHDYIQENGGVVNKGERLHCMNLDGTNHTVVQDLDFVPGGDTSNFITEPMIHRNIVYFCYSGRLYAVSLGDDIQNAVLLYGEEIADDGSHIVSENELYYELWADGDLTYFMAKNVKQKNGTYKDILYSYDPQDNEVKEIWQVPDESTVGAWDTTGVSVSSWYVSGGYIYFYLCGNNLWYTELNTGKTVKLADVHLRSGEAVFSTDYIAVMNKEIWGQNFGGGSALTGGDTLYIYNYSGELVNEISLEKIYSDNKNVTECWTLWVENGQAFVLANATVQDANSNHTTLAYILYSVDIESGAITETSWSVGE